MDPKAAKAKAKDIINMIKSKITSTLETTKAKAKLCIEKSKDKAKKCTDKVKAKRIIDEAKNKAKEMLAMAKSKGLIALTKAKIKAQKCIDDAKKKKTGGEASYAESLEILSYLTERSETLRAILLFPFTKKIGIGPGKVLPYANMDREERDRQTLENVEGIINDIKTSLILPQSSKRNFEEDIVKDFLYDIATRYQNEDRISLLRSQPENGVYDFVLTREVAHRIKTYLEIAAKYIDSTNPLVRAMAIGFLEYLLKPHINRIQNNTTLKKIITTGMFKEDDDYNELDDNKVDTTKETILKYSKILCFICKVPFSSPSTKPAFKGGEERV